MQSKDLLMMLLIDLSIVRKNNTRDCVHFLTIDVFSFRSKPSYFKVLSEDISKAHAFKVYNVSNAFKGVISLGSS